MIKLPAILDGAIRKKDNSFSLRFVTSLEIGKEERIEIDDAFQQEGWLIFSTNKTEVTLPTSKADTGRKSPSQILSGRMYVAWNKRKGDGKTNADFDTWYKSQLEAIGQQYLDELN